MVLSTSWVDGQEIHGADINAISAAINNISTIVVDARDYGVIADGAQHNNVANLLDCFAAAYALGATEVLLPAGVIITSEASLGTVTATSGNVYTNNGGIPLPTGNQSITVTGHGKGVTTLRLSSGFTRGFDFFYIADGQAYQDITIQGITFDRNNISGASIGPLSTITSTITLPGNGASTVLPGVSATTWKNAKWAYAPASNTGTLSNLEIWVGVVGSNVVATNYYSTSYTLVSGDQIEARLQEHVIIGTFVWGGNGYRGGQAMTINNTLIQSCEAINVTTIQGPVGTTSDNSFGVGINVENGSSQATVTNFLCNDVQIHGGAYGCAVVGGAASQVAGTYLDNIWYVDCFHDTLQTATQHFEAANFMIGSHAWVNRCGMIRCVGRRSGDVSCEIDQPWVGYEEDCQWEEGWAGIFRTSFVPPARTAAGPPTTTLNNGGTLTSGATTCTVTALPADVDRNGLALVDSELIWYQATNLAGTALTIWRGINATTAASHTTSATVTFVETHKTRIYSTRSSIKNKTITSLTGVQAGYCWQAYTNNNLPLPPLTIRDANVSIVGGDLIDGQVISHQGWCPEIDFSGVRVTQSGILSTQTSTAVGSAVSFPASQTGVFNTTTLATNSVPAPAPRITGRNNWFRIHGKAPNTSSGSYALFRGWDGYWKYDLEFDAEVSLADVPTTSFVYLTNWGAGSSNLVIAHGSRFVVKGTAPTEVGVTAPTGLFVGSTTYVTIQDALDVDLDMPSPISVLNVDSTQAGKIRSSKTPGTVDLDWFTGTDDQRFASARAFAAAQSHIPAIRFPAREVTLNVGGLTPYSGMKLIGPSGSVGSKNLEIGSGGVLVNHRVHINAGVETAALFNSQATVYDIHIFDLAFQDDAGVSQFWYQAPGTTLWASEWHGLTFYGFKHVIGSQTNPAPVDALVFTGYWEVIAGTDTQFNLAGSDNSLWRDGLLNLGSARTAGAGVYLMILDLLGKTDIGYMYITVNPGWKAMLLEGNTASGGANFYGGTFEGDQESGQSTTPTTSIIDITGGVWSFFGPRVNYVNGTTGATGVMTQTGGSAHFYDLTYLRDSLTPTPASFPILYQTGGVAQFYGGRSLTTSENLVVRWADTTTNTLLDANLTGNLVDISLAQALLNKNLTSGTNTFPTFNQSTTGNAATATKLATARNINGVAFDGSAAITIADPNAVEVVTYSGSLGATRPSGAQAVYWYNFPSTPTNALAQDIISGGAAMAVATYDPANIAQQVLGTTATQTVTHKNLTDATNTFPTFNQATTGNAGTATALATARTINGVSFNGSANITVTATPTTTTQFYDLSLIGFGQATVRAASSYGDFPFGVKLQRPVTFTSVTFRVNTADASGNLVCQLMKNGSLVSGTSTTIAAASQVAGGTSTGSWSFTTGDIISVYITAVGTTPGNGLIADVTGLA